MISQIKVNDVIKYKVYYNNNDKKYDNSYMVNVGIITKINDNLVGVRNFLTNVVDKIYAKDVIMVMGNENNIEKDDNNIYINIISIILLIQLFTIFVTYVYLYNFPDLLNIKYSINNTITDTVNTIYDYVNTKIFSSIGINTYKI